MNFQDGKDLWTPWTRKYSLAEFYDRVTVLCGTLRSSPIKWKRKTMFLLTEKWRHPNSRQLLWRTKYPLLWWQSAWPHSYSWLAVMKLDQRGVSGSSRAENSTDKEHSNKLRVPKSPLPNSRKTYRYNIRTLPPLMALEIKHLLCSKIWSLLVKRGEIKP